MLHTSKSSSVSPGNPQMMSVASWTPGTRESRVSQTRLNSSTVYSRFMAAKTVLKQTRETNSGSQTKGSKWESRFTRSGQSTHRTFPVFDPSVIALHEVKGIQAAALFGPPHVPRCIAAFNSLMLQAPCHHWLWGDMDSSHLPMWSQVLNGSRQLPIARRPLQTSPLCAF